MKFKSLIITLLASSIFLTVIICIWKIMATLQGLSFTNINFKGLTYQPLKNKWELSQNTSVNYFCNCKLA